MNDSWICIDEKLPEPHSFVLATLQTLHDRWVEIVGFGTITFTLPGRGRTIHVTHWMPIPQPPTKLNNISPDSAVKELGDEK